MQCVINPEVQILLGEDDRVQMYSAQMSNDALSNLGSTSRGVKADCLITVIRCRTFVCRSH